MKSAASGKTPPSRNGHTTVPSSRSGSRNGSISGSIAEPQSDSGSTRAPNGNGNGHKQAVPRRPKRLPDAPSEVDMDDLGMNGRPMEQDSNGDLREFQPGSTRKRWSMTSPSRTESNTEDGEDLLAEIESLLGETAAPRGPSR